MPFEFGGPMKRPILLGLALALYPAGLAAQEHKHSNELGTVQFPTSCNAAAQAKVNTAVAMIHSFWFAEARKTFEAAAAADPACGVAHWGIAITHFGNPFGGGPGPEGNKAGLAAAEMAASIGSKNARDQAYIDAAVAL